MKVIAGIPLNQKKRVIIVGGGFAALQVIKSIANDKFQIVLIDKNNYHQFQPLFHQVATAGPIATIGRHLAVADLPHIRFQGFAAWILWLFVHLMSILGAKNRIFVLINWTWNYFTYDQSLRLLINQKK